MAVEQVSGAAAGVIAWMSHNTAQHQHHTSSSDEPWAAMDRSYFSAHPGHHFYIRDILPGEIPSLRNSDLLIKLEGTGLYDALRKHLRAFPPRAASIRVTVLKIGRWTHLRCPVLDWEGRDPSCVWRLEANDNLREISAESVIAKCKTLAQQERWDERE